MAAALSLAGAVERIKADLGLDAGLRGKAALAAAIKELGARQEQRPRRTHAWCLARDCTCEWAKRTP